MRMATRELKALFLMGFDISTKINHNPSYITKTVIHELSNYKNKIGYFKF